MPTENANIDRTAGNIVRDYIKVHGIIRAINDIEQITETVAREFPNVHPRKIRVRTERIWRDIINNS